MLATACRCTRHSARLGTIACSLHRCGLKPRLAPHPHPHAGGAFAVAALSACEAREAASRINCWVWEGEGEGGGLRRLVRLLLLRAEAAPSGWRRCMGTACARRPVVPPLLTGAHVRLGLHS
jgi:hypothetical protein